MTTNIADYTTRKSYMANYAKANREVVNARKREWRKARRARETPTNETKPNTTRQATL